MTCDAANVITSTDLTGLKADIDTIDDVVESSLDTTDTKSGKTINTLLGQLKELGYIPPVVYAGGLIFTASDNTKTIDEAGIVYAPLPSALPFTTSGTFIGDDDARFFVVQGAGIGNITAVVSGITDMLVADIADLKTGTTIGGEIVSLIAGLTVQTQGYGAAGDRGDDSYFIKTAAQATTDGDVIDEYTNHTLDNTNVAILNNDGVVDFRAVGGRPFDIATKLDNSAVLLAADAQGHTMEIVGPYYFVAAVDLGLASTNLRTQILGVENTNFDSFDKSAFIFEGTAGIEVYAGCKIHDIEIKNIGLLAGSGTGLIADNVHACDINNVTCTNFERSSYIFCWVSSIQLLIAYQCTSGIELYNECTSTTVKNSYARECTTGWTIGGTVTYSTLQNCAADDCDTPFLIKGGSNVDISNCGAEISHANIEGFFEFDGTAASTVTISGGRFIMLGGMTTNCIAFTTIAAVNTFGTIIFSRMTTNSFSNPVEGFVKGKVRALLADSCQFADTFNLRVKEGEFGSIMMDGRSSATLRRHCKPTPKIGSSQTDANSLPNMLAITIEEVVDFEVAITDVHQVFVKFAGQNADSFLQLKVELFPMTATGTGSPYTYHEFAGWAYGNQGANGVDVTGSAWSFKGNDAAGNQNFYIDRTAIRAKALVRVTATGWCDDGFRDVLVTLNVATDDA